jgi:hypothetical protein
VMDELIELFGREAPLLEGQRYARTSAA